MYVSPSKVQTSTFLLTLIRHTDDVFDTAPVPLLYSGNVGPLKQPSFQRDVV